MATGPVSVKKANVNIKDLKKVIDLMRRAELTEVDIEQEGIKIRLRKGGDAQVTAMPMAQPVAMPAALPQAVAHAQAAAPVAASASAPGQGPIPSSGTTITAPMVGTFYRANSPENPPFVKEGDMLEVGKTICIIEAMKLMNEIKAETSGRVTKVLVENAQPVEYGQPLFVIEP